MSKVKNTLKKIGALAGIGLILRILLIGRDILPQSLPPKYSGPKPVTTLETDNSPEKVLSRLAGVAEQIGEGLVEQQSKTAEQIDPPAPIAVDDGRKRRKTSDEDTQKEQIN